jgi:hypothetical protein
MKVFDAQVLSMWASLKDSAHGAAIKMRQSSLGSSGALAVPLRSTNSGPILQRRSFHTDEKQALSELGERM